MRSSMPWGRGRVPLAFKRIIVPVPIIRASLGPFPSRGIMPFVPDAMRPEPIPPFPGGGIVGFDAPNDQLFAVAGGVGGAVILVSAPADPSADVSAKVTPGKTANIPRSPRAMIVVLFMKKIE